MGSPHPVLYVSQGILQVVTIPKPSCRASNKCNGAGQLCQESTPTEIWSPRSWLPIRKRWEDIVEAKWREWIWHTLGHFAVTSVKWSGWESGIWIGSPAGCLTFCIYCLACYYLILDLSEWQEMDWWMDKWMYAKHFKFHPSFIEATSIVSHNTVVYAWT